MKRAALFALICFFVLGGIGIPVDSPSFAKDEITIRIAVLKDLQEFDLSVSRSYKILALRTGEVLFEGRRLKTSKVTASPKGIILGGQEYSVERMAVSSKCDASISVNGRRFRGAIHVMLSPQKRLSVINVVGLEDYTRGVLYHEISHHWPMEALKAQAVASRSYALYRLKNAKEQDFDVTSDIYSQVYGGRGAERFRINQAVRRTKGQVLSYQGKILPAYFHATCGGLTEDVSELWKQDLPPLKGRKCGFCTRSPHYRWKRNLRLKNIQDQLNAHGHHLGLIKEIKVLKRNQSGRVRTLQITTIAKKVVTLSGKEFREILGPNLIKSNNYDFVMQGYFVDVVGYGWGHGVGMCQWGAYEMARQRHKYNEILQYYYSGSEIVDYKAVTSSR